MPTIVYVLSDGSRREVKATAGASLMDTAIKHNIKGIEAACGGCLSCATCHVYVDEAWLAKLPAPDSEEADMLGFVAAEQKPNSRLSCQIKADDEIDGIVVHIPASQ